MLQLSQSFPEPAIVEEWPNWVAELDSTEPLLVAKGPAAVTHLEQYRALQPAPAEQEAPQVGGFNPSLLRCDRVTVACGLPSPESCCGHCMQGTGSMLRLYVAYCVSIAFLCATGCHASSGLAAAATD